MEANQQEIKTIQTVLKKMNETWADGNPEALTSYFHDDVMIVAPDMKILGAGKKACIQSYVDFLNAASDISFKDDEPEVHLYDQTAVAFYKYDVSWTMDEKSHQEAGKELYVLNKIDGDWLVVMRKLIANE